MNKAEIDFLTIPEQLSNLDPVTYQYFNQLLNHRTILFNSAVDENVIEYIMMPLKDFAKDEKDEPVKLVLSTVGGSVVAGLSLCNIIDTYPKKLEIYVPNFAMSMGSIIMCAGNKNPNITKFAMPSSYFLIHDGLCSAEGESGSVRDLLGFYDALDEEVREYIINNTNISEEEYNKHTRRQWYFNAQKAKEYGLVNKIIGVDML